MANSNTTGSNKQHNRNTDCRSGRSSGGSRTNIRSSNRSRMNRFRNDVDPDADANTISSDSDSRFDPYPRHHNSAPRSVSNRSRNNNNNDTSSIGIGIGTGTGTRTNNNDTNSYDNDRRSSSDSHSPRSLLRDRPLAEPSSYRYPYNPLVAMNGNGLGGGLEHYSTTASLANTSVATRSTATPSANTTTAAATTTTTPSISATTTATAAATTTPKIRSHSPENDSVGSGSRNSSTSSHILPKIDESCGSSSDSTSGSDTSCNDEFIFRRNKKQGNYFHKTSNNDNSSTSLVDLPQMSIVSDNSSIESWHHSSSTLFDLLDHDADADADCCSDNFCDNHVTTTPAITNAAGETDTAVTTTGSLESGSASGSPRANPNNNTSWQQQQHSSSSSLNSFHLSTPSLPSLNDNSNTNSNSNINNYSQRRNSLNACNKRHQQHQQLHHHQRRLYMGASPSLPFLVSPPEQQQQTQTVPVVQGSNNTSHRLSSAAPFTTTSSATLSNNPILTKTRLIRDGQNSISSNPFVLASSSKTSSSNPRFRRNSKNNSSSAFSRKKANPFKRPKTTAQRRHSRQQYDHCDTVLPPSPQKCMVNFFYSAGVLLQLLVLLVIGTLVLWSRSQAAKATKILMQLRHTESLQLLKLHRLEDHSMHVHELIQTRLVRIHGLDSVDDLLHENYASYEEAENEGTDNDSSFPSLSEKNGKDGIAGDTTSDRGPHPLLAQYHQLREMSSQLRTHEVVLDIQDELQQTASEEIVANYGEGALKVVIELNFNGDDDGSAAAAAGNNNEIDGNDDDRSSGEYSNSDLNSSYDDRLSNNYGRTSGTNTPSQKGNTMAPGTYLSIVLWPDAPHAAWAWLEQIQRNIWNGARLEWDPTSTLLQIRPAADDPADRGHLGFVERHLDVPENDPDTHHGAWTIGLREVMVDDEQQQGGAVAAAASNKNNNIDDDDDGTVGKNLRAIKHGSPSQITSSSSSTRKNRLEMFINLTNNQEKRKHETCVGKIFGGFDALQRLLEGTTLKDDGEAVTNVNVKTVTVMHMSHQELELVYR